MKRGLSTNGDYVANYTRSKRRKLHPPMDFRPRHRYWISATRLWNYFHKDLLCDYLSLHSSVGSVGYNHRQNSFVEFVKKQGIKFEDNLVKYIHERKTPVRKVSEKITDSSVKKVIELMKLGVPIIHSAPLRDTTQRTHGVADLLVRSDYVGTLVEENPLTEAETKITAPNLNGNYHYVVIDIKWSTLPLRADGRHLLNSGSFPAYKAQVWIYNKALANIQGYLPQYAFILGRRWNFTSKKQRHNSLYCLDKLGVVDYKGVDREYIQRTKDAIAWYREVKQFGNEWSVSPPSRPELYPNMCVDSGKWNRQKEEIAKEIGEMTDIWYVGVKQRQHALNLDIKSWKDPCCTSSTLGMRGARAPIIDKIMSINRQNDELIRPDKIKSDMFNWKKECNEIFVDFETLMDIFAPFNNLPKQEKTDQIFMIGIYYRTRTGWDYKSFICNELTANEEFRIMNEFAMFVAKRNYPKLWYWHAEDGMWSRAENKHFDMTEDDEKKKDVIRDEWGKIGNWCDMAKLFRSEPIVIKNCFKFGLKSIVKAMNQHGMIPTKMDSECDSGRTAALRAWDTYQTSIDPVHSNTIRDIAKYNRFDVEALYDILTYLRKNHL